MLCNMDSFVNIRLAQVLESTGVSGSVGSGREALAARALSFLMDKHLSAVNSSTNNNFINGTPPLPYLQYDREKGS